MPATLVLNLIKIQGLAEEIDKKNKVAYFDIRRQASILLLCGSRASEIKLQYDGFNEFR